MEMESKAKNKLSHYPKIELIDTKHTPFKKTYTCRTKQSHKWKQIIIRNSI